MRIKFVWILGRMSGSLSLSLTHARTLSPPRKNIVVVQMGGAEGVRAREYGNLTLQTAGGLHMHCIPRSRAATAPDDNN